MDGEFIYVDEAGFNLTRTRRRGRNIIGHRAIVNVPGQRGGNITLCAAEWGPPPPCPYGPLQHSTHTYILGPIAQHNSSKSNRSYAIHCCLGQCLSTALLWFRTGFSNIHISPSYIFHHTLHSSTL